jgi:hypothetical protein
MQIESLKDDPDIYAQLVLKQRRFDLLIEGLSDPILFQSFLSAKNNKSVVDKLFADVPKETIILLLSKNLARSHIINLMLRFAD